MNPWLAWVQMLGAAIGTVNPAVAALISMIAGGVVQISADTDEDRALIDQWRQFCQTMIDHGGPPTADEHAQALAFANEEHAHNQGL